MDSLLTWKGVPLAIAFPSSLHRGCQQGKWSTELSAEILSESIGLDQLKKILSAGCRQVVTAPKSRNFFTSRDALPSTAWIQLDRM